MRWVVLAAALLVYLSPSLAVPTYRVHASSADASSNSVYQWGAESHSQPWKVHGLVATVSLGASESRFAVEADGSVWAWGRNKSGQLGQGSLKSSRWPKRIPYLGRVIQVAAGPDHPLALLRDGRVMSWGRQQYGPVGRRDVPRSASSGSSVRAPQCCVGGYTVGWMDCPFPSLGYTRRCSYS